MRRAAGPAAAFFAASLAAAAQAATHTIVQIDRSFRPSEITIAVGDSLLFSNQDEFIHQIYVDYPNFDYDSAEQPPGETLTIHFPDAGTFPVRCHIHPKMLLTVHVR
jgi:plastocyanin